MAIKDIIEVAKATEALTATRRSKAWLVVAFGLFCLGTACSFPNSVEQIQAIAKGSAPMSAIRGYVQEDVLLGLFVTALGISAVYLVVRTFCSNAITAQSLLEVAEVGFERCKADAKLVTNVAPPPMLVKLRETAKVSETYARVAYVVGMLVLMCIAFFLGTPASKACALYVHKELFLGLSTTQELWEPIMELVVLLFLGYLGIAWGLGSTDRIETEAMAAMPSTE